jgi:recombination protein RecT
MTTPAKKTTISNFLNFPNTKKFLEDNLKERRSEFVSNLITLCENDYNLASCDPKKLMLCAMNATALNLPLNKNLGFAHIIPYKDKSGEQIPNFQIGYKGLIQLAVRSGFYEFLNACEIREGEIERNKVTGEIRFIKEKPGSKVVGYLAYLKLKTGFSSSLYMTLDEIEKHALRFSKMYQYDKKNNKKSSKWSDSDARPKMSLKTVLKGLLGTYGVITTELAKAFDSDTETESNDAFRNVEEAEVIEQKESKEETKTVKI